ncbi:MAG: phosphate acyltransferase PlsX [Candidatus Hydrogenedentes bacterium]|nr:phosphate acyltransferase PlsX [Candidatus Hydrogenedentota bacterium]
MRIALDAMGSDHAPGPEVRGAVEASLQDDTEYVLVGDQKRLQEALAPYKRRGRITIIHASQAIRMDDQPVMAVRQKKDSSLLVALRLVKTGEADACVSAGNTGAVMVAARTILGRIKGVSRSAICQTLPTIKKPVLLIDMGANIDCTARQLCDFAEMGMLYMEHVMRREKPRVGLLNIGEEHVKGNELLKTVHRYLSAAEHINFIGNIEPKSIYNGDADVVVCDGFVGNVVLKTTEATAVLVKNRLYRELMSTWPSKIGAFFSMGAYRRLRRETDPNTYSGAPLLGVKGVVIILHGSGSSLGVKNSLLGARRAVRSRINEHIRTGIEALRHTEAHLNAQENNP